MFLPGFQKGRNIKGLTLKKEKGREQFWPKKTICIVARKNAKK
jgi:hypothetical protein